MVGLDGVDPAGQVGERVAVGGQHHRHAVHGRDPVERLDVAGDGVAVDQARDVGRDGGQHVVARQQHALGGIPQAQVVVGVARREQGEPVAAGQPDRGRVGQAQAGVRRTEPLEGGSEPLHDRLAVLRDGVVDGRAPRRLDVPRQVRVGVVEVVVEGLAGEVEGVEPGLERLRRDDAGTGRLGQQAGGAEVVGVRVGDEHGVDPRHRDAGRLEAGAEGVPAGLARQTGVDEGDAVAVLQEVGVHVAEAGQVDGQLQAQDAGRHLRDLVGGGLLLLLGDLRRPGTGRPGVRPLRHPVTLPTKLTARSIWCRSSRAAPTAAASPPPPPPAGGTPGRRHRGPRGVGASRPPLVGRRLAGGVGLGLDVDGSRRRARPVVVGTGLRAQDGAGAEQHGPGQGSQAVPPRRPAPARHVSRRRARRGCRSGRGSTAARRRSRGCRRGRGGPRPWPGRRRAAWGSSA